MARILSGMTTDSEPWVPSFDTFGSRLAIVRHRMGWNVKEAARECGLPAASWRLWEMDGGQPRNVVTIAMTIANRTGCDFQWLLIGPEKDLKVRRSNYVNSRVLLPAGRAVMTPERPSSNGHLGTSRPVRQTRPLVGAALAQRVPVSV